MLDIYLEDQFGPLQAGKAGQLLDKDGQTIGGRYENIDKLSDSMEVVATVFAGNGDKFVRVLTTIRDEKGERVIGTELDRKGEAYMEVSNGNIYHGQANILGDDYITRYVPIYNENKQIIGIFRRSSEYRSQSAAG